MSTRADVDDGAPDRVQRIPWGSQTPSGTVLLTLSWEVLIMAISVLAIVNLGLLLLLPDGDLAQVVIITEAWLTLFFVVDIARRLRVAGDRRGYLTRGHGWLDVLGALPFLRVLRLLRVALTLRLLRRLGGPDESIRAYFADRAAGGLFLVLFLAILVMEFGAFLVLAAERAAPEANIVTAGDAVWFTIVTVATVGYGDQYPVTDLGRVISSVIIIVGVGLFGTLTGYLAHAFVRPVAAPTGDTSAVPTSVLPAYEAASMTPNRTADRLRMAAPPLLAASPQHAMAEAPPEATPRAAVAPRAPGSGLSCRGRRHRQGVWRAEWRRSHA
jgi:voltage-gated potassium channel